MMTPIPTMRPGSQGPEDTSTLHIVGDVTLAYESVDLRAETDLTITIFTAEPNSPTAQALTLLASWAATANDTSSHADSGSEPDRARRRVIPSGLQRAKPMGSKSKLRTSTHDCANGSIEDAAIRPRNPGTTSTAPGAASRRWRTGRTSTGSDRG